MTLHELYRQGKVFVESCLGADTGVQVWANTDRRRRQAVDCLTRARAINIQEDRRNGYVYAMVPTRTVRKWREEK